MRILKHKEVVTLKIRKCEYPECGIEFLGHPISKFCPAHNSRSRQNIKIKKKTSVTENNRIIDHECKDITSIILECSLKGCREKYEIEICPKQYIYPKFCPEHRNKYKRESFLKSIRKIEKNLRKALMNDEITIPKHVIVKKTKTTIVLFDKDNKKYKLCVMPTEKILLSKHIIKLTSFNEVDKERAKKEHLGFAKSIGEVYSISEFKNLLLLFFKG